MSKTILKVKLLDLGSSGVFIQHVHIGVRKMNGAPVKFRETHKITYDAPANAELIAHFDGLQENFRHLACTDENVAAEDVHVIEARISPDGNYIQLVGTVRSVGETKLKFPTARTCEADGYMFFGECLAKIKALFAEAKSYITEKKVMNTDQMVLQFSVADKKFDEKHPEGVAAMSEEEKDAYARERLEKKGAIIIENEFVDPGDGENEEDEQEQNEGADAPTIEGEPATVEPTEETPKETAKTGKIRKLKQEPENIVIPQQPAMQAFGE